MRRLLFMILLLGVCWLHLAGQDIVIDDWEEWQEREEVLQDWLKDLYTMGVEVDGDSLIIHEEVLHLFQDSIYYNQAFPEDYSWELTIAALQAMHFKLAFWYLINIYHNEREAYGELVLKTIVAFKEAIEPIRLLMSSFYTYAYFSPDSGQIIDGKLEVTRPDLLDQKFHSFKKLIDETAFILNQ